MKGIITGILSICILSLILPTLNIKAESKGVSCESSYKDTLYMYGSSNEYAKLIYNRMGYYFEYVLNGQNLMPNTSYTLVYYPEKENNILCIDDGVSNMIGALNMKDDIDIPTLPYTDDPNGDIESTTDIEGATGAKIWLVKSHEINCFDHVLELQNLTSVLYPTSLISYIEML